MKIISVADSRKAQAESMLKDMMTRINSAVNPQRELAIILNDNTEKWLSMFVTVDDKMLALKEMVRKLSRLPDPVLITGPSGTGKELIARALHGLKHISSFYPVNCAGMPEALIESELFGHTAGSFTGAKGDNLGILRTADEGTVFLDEIGEATPSLQAKLLRAIQPGYNGKYYIRPVGGTKHYEITCRLIAASKVDLMSAVREGKFREDLYGRLMTFELQTTPLSARPIDKLAILRSLGCEDDDEIDDPFWVERINVFNVRALQAYARRKAILQ
jgi:transcriptional regulator with PAS, ATPase and Fis domain